MLKVKKIKLSGFRGILSPQELDLAIKGSPEPRSFVLFGLNSSGKTSFVDGIEWFLSETNKIEWLRRDEAEEKAYPHQAAKDKGIDSLVEMEFYDPENKFGKLIKSYDHSKITKPILSDATKFKSIYTAFVIRPYFRYLEVVDFVCSKGKDKYERLAQWMGFESEFQFQEKIARSIHQKLKDYEKVVDDRIITFEQQIKQLIGGLTAIDAEILAFCNGIISRNKVDECTNLSDIWETIPEISKKQKVSSMGVTIEKLTKIETSLAALVLKTNLHDELDKLDKKIDDFRKDEKLIEQIDVIGLHTKALDILTKQKEDDTKCPVCGKEWKREKLMEHIKGELDLLRKTKDEKDAIELDTASLKRSIIAEADSMKRLLGYYKDSKEIIESINNVSAKDYFDDLDSIGSALSRVPVDVTVKIKLEKEKLKSVIKEKDAIAEIIKTHKTKIQPSAEEIKLAEDIEKLTQIKTSWKSLEEARTEQNFVFEEIKRFYALKDEVIKIIQNNIKSRFDETSDRIGKYFGILRNDKDIKDIKIVLNEEKGKAAGRSAEIELSYYEISVRPAYKVLSESLLNSLGLAVYFTCIKQFNKECNFIVLDDIMNSLDIDKRDTLLDLIEQEFIDYQIILFTHDYYWFQKIMRRFPGWIHKKIKGWDYIGGARIDYVKSTKEEIEEYLSDSTKIEEAGRKLGLHVESVLNELCENIWATVRYRYVKNDPPTMEELFEALHRRLKEKLNAHPIINKVLETKKYEPILRNFVSHPRGNQPTSVSPQEVKRAADEWFSLESEFWCDRCNRFVEHHRSKDSIECQCGLKKLAKEASAPPLN